MMQPGFPGGSDGKESACHAGDLGLTPGSGRSPGGGKDYPLQHSFLENSMDRGAWWPTVPEQLTLRLVSCCFPPYSPGNLY